MHEVIFHFPCSICWHGKAAGLCPRSSCISSPRKRFLRLSGQILSRTPGRTRGVCGRQGSGPKPFSCTWAPRRRGPCCYLSRVCVCPSRPRIILSAWLPLRGAGAGGGGGGGPTPPSAPGRCVEPQRPLLGHGGTVRPAAAEGLRAGAAGHGDARGGGGWRTWGGGVSFPRGGGIHPGFRMSWLGVLWGLFTLISGL